MNTQTTTPVHAPRSTTSQRALWLISALFAVAIAGYSVPPYLLYEATSSRIPLNDAFSSHMLWLSLHAVPAAIALVLGPLQFLSALRTRRPRVHRITGRVYIVCVLVAGIAGVGATLVSTSGFAAQAGLLFLVLAWIYSAWRAVDSVRCGRYAEHRMWMARNYALTFSAVPLRLFILAGRVAMEMNPSLEFTQVYAASVWGAIAVCSFFVEWIWLGSRSREAAGEILADHSCYSGGHSSCR